jgi:hypothetical protein
MQIRQHARRRAALRKGKFGTLRASPKPGASIAKNVADALLNPAVHAASNIASFSSQGFGEVPVNETFESMLEAVADVRSGDMAGPEAMLVCQAQSLNAIFTELARRSALNMCEYLEASEKYMRLALKAQAQCRATIEALATIKNPPLVIARQANISAGPQQVNNGAAPVRTEVPDNRPNELLEHQHEQRLDLGTKEAPGSGDPELVTVEQSHRTQDGCRKSPIQPERLQGRP